MRKKHPAWSLLLRRDWELGLAGKVFVPLTLNRRASKSSTSVFWTLGVLGGGLD